MLEKTMDGMLKKLETKQISCPASVFRYFSLCKSTKLNGSVCKMGSNFNDLPFVSKITDKFTPEGVIEINWSFLKY